MGRQTLWKYCTKEQCREMILSFHLTGRSDWTEEKQLACLYAVSNHAEQHYQPVRIPKKDGSMRRLLVPDPLLKTIQRQILHQILEQLPVSSYASAYHKGASIGSNASPHVGKDVILKLDIRDFFGQIRFMDVYRLAFPGIYFPPAAASLLAHLCCYQEYLPQGAPTSAAVSNLVMKPFDEHIGAWCEERGICYTRYCDDMTFSGDFDAGAVKRKVKHFLETLGYELNDEKTRVMSKHQRQVVTGIVVNRKPQVTREYRHNLRKELYYCRKYGAEEHLTRIRDQRFLPFGEAGLARYRMSLRGRIQFVLQINPEDPFFLEQKRWIMSEWK